MIKAFVFINFIFSFYLFFTTSNILQRQYYSIHRYLLYIKENKKILTFKIISILSIYLSFINQCFCFLLLFNYLNIFKNKIVKFKFTNRIKRHLLIFTILNIFAFLTLYKTDHTSIIALTYFLLYWLSYICSLLVEKCIQMHYLKKAKEKLKTYKTRIIAITGSFGKTSCKNFVYELLRDKYNVLASKHSFNTLNGVLLTINNELKPYHEYLILEIGVDQKNGMNKFVKHFNFSIGLISAIGNQHLKTFKNIENIAKEKLKLFDNCKDHIIINNDDSYIKNKKVNISNIKCSTINKLDDIYINRLSNNTINVKIYDKTYTCAFNVLGKHNLSNLALSIGVVKALNVDDQHIISCIEKLENVEHRLSKIHINNWTIIDDSYNSNYIGFLNALEELSSCNTYKVLITPGIIENPSINQKLIDKINQCCDLVLLTNHTSDFEQLHNKKNFKNFTEAYNYLRKNYVEQVTTILIENDVPDIFLR